LCEGSLFLCLRGKMECGAVKMANPYRAVS